MKKTILGDVYAFRTDRGYRLLQWAYFMEKQGKFVRIFPGFYGERPANLQSIVEGDCSYMLNFDIPKLYRKGLLELWGSFPLDDLHPFPTHDIHFFQYADRGEFEICEFLCHQKSETYIGDATGKGIPEKYRHIKLVNGVVDPIWFLYLLSSDFDMTHWHLFNPKEKWDEFEKKYGDLIFGKGKTKT